MDLKSTIPQGTIQVLHWSVPHTIKTEKISNGLGSPVNINLIPEQMIVVPSVVSVSISADNLISQKNWDSIKGKLLSSGQVEKSLVTAAENDISENGWFSD